MVVIMSSSTMAALLLSFLSTQLCFLCCQSKLMGKSDGYISMDSPKKMKEIYPGTGMFNLEKFGWYKVVALIMTYESEKETMLLRSHFKSWIRKMPKDFDIVIVTDASDERSYEEILPDAKNVKCTVDLYKTPAPKEGAQARMKTIDSLRYIYEKYQDSEKEMFLKIDPDTYVVPENLMKITKELYRKTHPLPIDFGRVDCITGGQACYSLGASYGLNKSGLSSMLSFLNQNPQVFGKQIIEAGKNDRMLDEDFFTSYVFRVATGYPTIHISGMSIRLQARNYLILGPHEGEWDTTNKHITIHLVKEPDQFDLLDTYYYYRGIALKKWYRL